MVIVKKKISKNDNISKVNELEYRFLAFFDEPVEKNTKIDTDLKSSIKNRLCLF